MTGLKVHIAKALSSSFSIDVDFSIPSGMNVLFGPSGAGKTTLLNCIAGIIRPDEGLIALNERPIFDSASGLNVPIERRRIGYVFQTLALFPHYTVEQNVGYGLAGRKNGRSRNPRIHSILEAFRIAHTARRKPGEISGGERQRAALARTLITEPELLLLDEPLSALDEPIKFSIIDDLKSWNQDRNLPVLYVTHSHAEVTALNAEVILLNAGRIISR